MKLRILESLSSLRSLKIGRERVISEVEMIALTSVI